MTISLWHQSDLIAYLLCVISLILSKNIDHMIVLAIARNILGLVFIKWFLADPGNNIQTCNTELYSFIGDLTRNSIFLMDKCYNWNQVYYSRWYAWIQVMIRPEPGYCKRKNIYYGTFSLKTSSNFFQNELWLNQWKVSNVVDSAIKPKIYKMPNMIPIGKQ